MEGVEKTFYTPLAGERLRPLGHLSVSALIGANALLIKRFFTLLVENAKIYVCCFLQQKPERLVNSLAQTAQIRHTGVLQTFIGERMSLTLQQMDAISPAGSWTDTDIIAWAHCHGMDTAPITYVPLQTTAQEQPDIARIDWRTMTVWREHRRPLL